MQQVLFTIPVKFSLPWIGPIDGVPILGYGAMLFLAIVACTILLLRTGVRQGFDRDRLYDLEFWVIVVGIIGARLVYMIQYRDTFPDQSFLGLVKAFFKIWNGGIVLYGGLIGGCAAYGVAWLWLRHRKHIHIPTW